ncbi:hypothetical protein [Sandarakinorhabdus cyanobacteriorum]|nr:hypothetical protein [Sandarakinorhabdus cyanobacteriorum]
MLSATELTLGELSRAERDAHHFPLKSALPRPIQLERLQRSFALALKQDRDVGWVVGAAALRLILVSGRPLNEIHAIKRAPKLSALRPNCQPDWPRPALVELNGHSPALWLEAGRSAHRSNVTPKLDHVGRSSKGVWLGLDPTTVALVQSIIGPEPLVTADKDPAKWPHLFAATTCEELAAAIEEFRKQASTRLGVGSGAAIPKITQCRYFLPTRLTACFPADPAVACLVTNTPPKRNATKSYYSSVSLADAQRYQHTAISALPAMPAAFSPAPGASMQPPQALRAHVIGSPYCPTEAALKMLGNALRSAAAIGRGRLDRNRALKVDHAFTAYCWLFFSLHTGWRTPRKKLLPTVADIDWDTGALLIEDKNIGSAKSARRQGSVILDDFDAELDAEDQVRPSSTRERKMVGGSAPSRRRWLPLSDRVLRQLQNYYEHTRVRALMQRRQRAKTWFTPLTDRAALEAYLQVASRQVV